VELFFILAIVVAFEYAAARWGYDSRDAFRRLRRR
jgi:hypothetical protein